MAYRNEQICGLDERNLARMSGAIRKALVLLETDQSRMGVEIPLLEYPREFVLKAL